MISIVLVRHLRSRIVLVPIVTLCMVGCTSGEEARENSELVETHGNQVPLEAQVEWSGEGPPPRQSEDVPEQYVEPPPLLKVWDHADFHASIPASMDDAQRVQRAIAGAAAIVEAVQLTPREAHPDGVRTTWRLEAYFQNPSGVSLVVGSTFVLLQPSLPGQGGPITSRTYSGWVGARAALVVAAMASNEVTLKTGSRGDLNLIYLFDNDRAIWRAGPEVSAALLRRLLTTTPVDPLPPPSPLSEVP